MHPAGDELHNIVKLYACHSMFVAIRQDNKCIRWGARNVWWFLAVVLRQLNVLIACSRYCYNLLQSTVGRLGFVRWGKPESIQNWEHHGAHLQVEPLLVDIQDFCSNHQSFAAVLADGSTQAWGDFQTGGNNRELQLAIREVSCDELPSRWGRFSRRRSGANRHPMIPCDDRSPRKRWYKFEWKLQELQQSLDFGHESKADELDSALISLVEQTSLLGSVTADKLHPRSSDVRWFETSWESENGLHVCV